jgi:hypothetical protein
VSGATRMAAPLPIEPRPSNIAGAAVRHDSPSRRARSSTTVPGPYPRYGSYRPANAAARLSRSTWPYRHRTSRRLQAISVSSVHGHGWSGAELSCRITSVVPGTKNWAPTASPTDSPSKLSKHRSPLVISTAILPRQPRREKPSPSGSAANPHRWHANPRRQPRSRRGMRVRRWLGVDRWSTRTHRRPARRPRLDRGRREVQPHARFLPGVPQAVADQNLPGADRLRAQPDLPVERQAAPTENG